MAFSATKTINSVFGNLIVKVYDLNFDSVTAGEVKTGMGDVIFASYIPATSDKHGIVYHNYSDTGSTRAAGSVYIDGVTSSDTGKLFVIGR